MDTELVRLARLLRSFAINQIIASATRLGVPTLLAAGDRTLAELSERTGIPAERMGLVMAVLVDLGIVERRGGGFGNAAMGEHLREDGGRLYGQALLAADLYYRTWQQLDHSLLTGRSAFAHVHGVSFWDYLDRNHEEAGLFARTMGAGSDAVAACVLDRFDDVPPEGLVIDVGGGDGSLVAAALERWPRVRGVVVELPGQLDPVRRTLRARGVVDRCEVVGGDMFTDLPAGGDLYVFKGVLHNWHDEQLLPMLRTLPGRLAPAGRVAVVERSMPPQAECVDMHRAINSLTMTLLFGSTDRTSDHYADLLRRSGLRTDVWTAEEHRIDVITGWVG